MSVLGVTLHREPKVQASFVDVKVLRDVIDIGLVLFQMDVSQKVLASNFDAFERYLWLWMEDQA